MAGVDYAIAQGLADADRLGVGGWSYGGIPTNYVITKTERPRPLPARVGRGTMSRSLNPGGTLTPVWTACRGPASAAGVKGKYRPTRRPYRRGAGCGGGGGSGTFELKMSCFNRHIPSGSFCRTSMNFPLSAGIPVSFIQ